MNRDLFDAYLSFQNILQIVHPQRIVELGGMPLASYLGILKTVSTCGLESRENRRSIHYLPRAVRLTAGFAVDLLGSTVYL